MDDSPDLVPPPPTGPSRSSWLRRRFIKLPIWAWIVLVILVLVGVSSASSSEKGDKSHSSNTDSTPQVDTAAPATEAPSTSEPPTTTAARTTTTTISPGDQKDVEILLAATLFNDPSNSTRLEIIDEIENNFILDRLDVLTVDVVDDSATPFVLRVEGSSGYSTAEYQTEQAWELADYWSELWLPDGAFRNEEGTLKPSLTIVVDGRRYIASYDLMVRLAQRTVSQSEWLNLARA